jgi:hypothetical protein
VGPALDASFDVEAFGRAMLAVSYQTELRPEALDRPTTVFDAQRPELTPLLSDLMERWVRAGRLLPNRSGEFRLAVLPGPAARARWRRYLARSRRRSTLRWLKHVVTVDEWLAFLVRKVERRTGTRVELSRREQRWPLIFLWPRAIRVLRTRPSHEAERDATF